MAIEQYIVGNKIRLQGTFKDSTGALADPTTVTVKIRKPDDAVSEVPAVRLSLGVFYYDYTPDQEGSYVYRFAGTGAIVAANETTFLTRTSF